MPYLIDGHNVVGQTPGLSLADPDDEAQLTALVRRWCVREKRKATIIFDGGLPGGVSQLSNADVKVIFASGQHTSGDDLLLNRIKAEKNPGGLIVVSSDRRIAEAAKGRRMEVLSARTFGQMLHKAAERQTSADKEKVLNKEEISEWEALFSAKKRK